MSITPYYLRLIINSASTIQIATDSTFTNLIASFTRAGFLTPSCTVELGNDGLLRFSIDGTFSRSFFLTTAGCSSLEFVSVDSSSNPEYNVTLNPGNVGILLGETKYNDIVLTGAPNDWTSTVCCVHPMTIVRTSNGPRRIKDIESGDLVYSHKGKEIEVLFNIQYKVPSSQFYKLRRGLFRKNVPSSDLFLTKGHPVLFNSRLVNIEDVEDAESVEMAPTVVYNLCTKNQEYVEMQGIHVSSYSKPAWKEFLERNEIIFEKK